MHHVDFRSLRKLKAGEIQKLAEHQYRQHFFEGLGDYTVSRSKTPLQVSAIPVEDLLTALDAGILTFLLHCEARIASSLGHGFYTIGPCGEELLAAVALHLREFDASALHYRHVSTAICRQLRQGGKKIEDVALDRARGYTCSIFDPVTGGKHCAIGGTSRDYLVTSTLASQAPPAVGRALAIPLASKILGLKSKFSPDSISCTEKLEFINVSSDIWIHHAML